MESLPWLIFLGSATLLLRVGLGLQAGGLVRSKNAGGMMLRVVCDFCFAALAFWAIGAAILQQYHNGFFAINHHAIIGWDAGFGAQTFFLLSVVLIASGVVTGAIAERSTFGATWCASIAAGGLIIPVTLHWAWFGWLDRMHFLDVAGAASVHVAGAVCAVVGARIVGPRTGKYNRDGSSTMIPGHNVPLTSGGVLLTLAAWVPMVAGCSLVNDRPLDAVAMNVLLSAAAGGVVGLFYGSYRYGKPELQLAFSGLLGGLVAICGAGGMVGAPSAVLIGAVAGWITPMLTIWLDLKFRIDDPSGLIAVHGGAGAWGCLAAGVFAANTFGGKIKQLGVQAVGLAAIVVFVAVMSVLLFKAVKAVIGVRVREEDEFEGLDLAEHDINAYPDFQQTMIKSYHMREA